MAVTHRSKSATIGSSNATFNRFLKPGALARLRDSRISTAAAAAAKVYVNSQIVCESGGAEQLQQVDESFLFTVRTFGPRILHRKKLGARKSAFVAPASGGGVESRMQTQTLVAGVAARTMEL